jgi:hypothetical protein
MWHLPLATLNQLVVYDELAAGRKPRWLGRGAAGAKDLDALLADALTGSV